MVDEPRLLAVLIDGENISPDDVEAILNEAAQHGVLKIRRVYGNWFQSDLKKWENVARDNAIRTVQPSSNVSGKNSTDLALTIDAMHLLYEKKVDGFCIVSSDSDYAGLAIDLHEQGKFVLGIGGKKTPMSLVSACDQFTHIETITMQGSKRNTKWVEQVVKAIGGNDGWVLLTDVGQRLRAADRSFDPRVYGFVSLSSMIKSRPNKFIIEDHEVAGRYSGHKVRLKT